LTPPKSLNICNSSSGVMSYESMITNPLGRTVRLNGILAPCLALTRQVGLNRDNHVIRGGSICKWSVIYSDIHKIFVGGSIRSQGLISSVLNLIR